jgi:hypothetical protein
VDRDFNEYESFYFTAQSYLKQAITDLNQETSRVSESELAGSEVPNDCKWLAPKHTLGDREFAGLQLLDWAGAGLMERLPKVLEERAC